jgi:hypothetical protein
MDSANQISSLKKLLETKRNRSGYGERTGLLYQETDLMEFLECADPYQFLSTYNKVSFLVDANHFSLTLMNVQNLRPSRKLPLPRTSTSSARTSRFADAENFSLC